MKAGTVLALIALTGYLSMEAYAFRKASHRMEPAYIHDLLVKANSATQACDAANASLQSRFDRTLQRVTDRYRTELANQQPDMDSNAIDLLIEENAQTALIEVEEQLASTNCTNIEIQKHFRRFEIYAKKTR